MEVKMRGKWKEKTLAGLFLRYALLFCVNTVVVIGGMFLLLQCAGAIGIVLPANYAEMVLADNMEKLRKGNEPVEALIPAGCTYGIYGKDGEWVEGDFPEEERRLSWEQYEKGNIYARGRGYYQFIYMDDGNVCIVKYHLMMCYADEKLNALLPAPEFFMLLLDVIFFFLNMFLVSRGFAKKIKAQLWELRGITEKIAENNLAFDTKTSDIKEINEVMASFGQMRDALQDSLKKQWDMEKQKQDQLSALAHDIKTPLTIIRGNAELLAEEEMSEEKMSGEKMSEEKMSEENRECTGYILSNTAEIEHYLEAMLQVLRGGGEKKEETLIKSSLLEQSLRKTAEQLAAAEKFPVSFTICHGEGLLWGNTESILRAWENIVSNAAEYTNPEKGMDIVIKQEEKEGARYLAASVRDYGKGFTSQELSCADEEFYSGDASRHGRKHQGLGLAIAKRFAEEQGGFLKYKNCSDGEGAEVALWLKMKEL